MSTEGLIRGFFIFIICGIVAYCSYFREDIESSAEEKGSERPRYSNYLPAYMLPEFVLIVLIGCTAYYGWEYSSRLLLSWGFGIFAHISLFYLILLLLLPFLRKYFSARSCAELWLLPTMLYMAEHSFMSLPEPLLIITLPNDAAKTALIIWLAGCMIVFCGYILSHLMFRHRILKNAVLVEDPEVLEIWEQEREYGNFKKEFKLVISPNTGTPLSVGLFKRSTRVVLPERKYSAEELHLIFRHELIHIGREDSGTKFFMMFCTTFCWFNPLMWLAMRKSADDLELSCDETVLLGASADRRKKYAELILQTVGDNHGFTTCLSASASALRYRLSNIVKQRKRFNGGLIVGIILFIFMMTSGYVALGYETGTGEDFIFNSGTAGEHVLRSVSFWDGNESDYYDCIDEEAFKAYLAGLEFIRITGNYTFPEKEHEMVAIFIGGEGAFGVTLTDTAVKIVPLHGEKHDAEYYYLTSDVDWEYISSLLAEQINYYDDELSVQPELKIYLKGLEDDGVKDAEEGEVASEDDGEKDGEKDGEAGEDDSEDDGEADAQICPGVIFNTIIDGKVTESIDPVDIPAALVFSDLQTDGIHVEFSHSVYNDYTIEVENWDRTERDFIGLEDYISEDIFKLMPYDAHYSVYSTFRMEDGTMIDMVFKFDVDMP